MRRSLVTALLMALLGIPDVGAQVLDQTLVPRGQLRLQAHPTFTSWDARFGRTDAGSVVEEGLGEDLTDPTSRSLFPGLATLAQLLEGLSGTSGYVPILGSTQGRVGQSTTRIEFGGQLGVSDWLTVGLVVPWARTLTAIDLLFVPDTLLGNVGLNPSSTNPTAVNAFLSAASASDAAAQANAVSTCAAGPGAGCTAARALAGRTAAFHGSARSAYGASPFFPLSGSSMAVSLAATAGTLDADLAAAGLGGLGAQMAFATQRLAEGDLALLPTRSGAGIDGAALSNRTGLWAVGDIEASVLIRVADNITPSAGGPLPSFGYRMSVGLLARLPTGTQEDPDVFLDFGTGDKQTDVEGSVNAAFTWGARFGMAARGRYGIQGAARLVRRVAPHEVAMPPASTRALVTWEPAAYVGLEAVPSLRLTEQLVLTGEYRFFYKGRDGFSLADPMLSLDPDVLGRESGIKLHQAGVGLRYDTVRNWLGDEAPRPIQAHLRLIHAVAGSGGQVPKSTRVEAGIRLFKRFWGPTY